MSVRELDFKVTPEEILEWIDEKTVKVFGNINGNRVPSRVLESYIQHAVRNGARTLYVYADGQHGIGGRIFPTGETVRVIVEGPVGQRLGSMGMFGTEIVVKGSASDDVGWINCGAKITVLGDVTNGAFNAAAQGILYVQGSGGARCDTLTKRNPRFDPPQSWYFRDVGDSFAEFKAGGISVVCGVNPRNPDNILGYRPCVGMVGGVIYFRGPIQGYSEKDVKLEELTEEDWKWLTENMRPFLEAIDRISYYEMLTRDPSEWRKLVALTPEERKALKKFKISIAEFRENYWEKAVGKGGIFADYIKHERSVLPYITTGKDRRYKPVWNNEKYLAPCAYACPSGIPTHIRTKLLREGKANEAYELTLKYSPLPASICGYICPSPCMDACTRGKFDISIAINELGRAVDTTDIPKKEEPKGKKISVIGGGPAGISAAWQLALLGYEVELYEASEKLAGKLEYLIPKERLPRKVLEKEIERFKKAGVFIKTNTPVNKELFQKIYRESDAVIVAVGAHVPRRLNFPGSEHAITAYEFLREINEGKKPDLKGRSVAIIGAGNVGMDVATEALTYGAKEVVAIDIQKPAAFGKELELAVAKGAKIIWPKFTERYDADERKLYFMDGTFVEADVVIISIGDMPRADFLPDNIELLNNCWLKVDEKFRTSDPKIYAIGDVTGLGLATHAVGHGRLAAEIIDAELSGKEFNRDTRAMIPYERIKVDYYQRVKSRESKITEEAKRCLSCGICRDCGVCETTCYWGAISRIEHSDGTFEYIVDDEKCIGCGFCAGVCPCGIWEMVRND